MRLTVGQALVRFLTAQHSERDGVRQRFFAGCWGIFGHGNVAGLGEALLEASNELRYYQGRNEQAMVHAAVGYARMKDRLQAFACTSSIGPGATNMVTGAALATVNRIPVLLLPGDVFATRAASPLLQELEDPRTLDVSVNDCLRPVSRYFDRIWRPEQLPAALLQAMRVLTDPAETGAVTIALPQDTAAEAYDWPEELFADRVWRIPRPRPEPQALAEAAAAIRRSRRPLLVAGGGVHYSDATAALRDLAEQTGIPVAETQAGKGALPYDHPAALGAIGATGTTAANAIAREADLVIGAGTRWSDFTTASNSLFPPARRLHQRERGRVRRGETFRPLGHIRRAGRIRGPRRRTAGLAGRSGVPRAGARARGGMGCGRRARVPPRPRAAARAVGGDRGGQRRERAAGRRRLRGRQHAR